ncbi:MAG: hypothetical protein MJB14_07450, partial [Spirochaetes bacterium]|nr:hypothetical protein [Spirochaetota bacterium]
EIAQFKSVEEYSDEQFIELVDSLENNFHIQQKGYVDTELIKGKEKGDWIMIQHWRTMEEAKESSKKFAQSPATESFRNALDPKSVNLHFTNQIKTWNLD